MSNAAASYLPDCQVITLKPHFDAFADPSEHGVRSYVIVDDQELEFEPGCKTSCCVTRSPVSATLRRRSNCARLS